MTVLTRIAERLQREGGLLAQAVAQPAEDVGPTHPWEPVAAIHEGYLLHYGDARIVATDDRDLGLLAGDRLYALGLGELAEAGDLDAVRTMAEVIARAACAHAAGAPEAAGEAWRAAPSGPSPAPGDR